MLYIRRPKRTEAKNIRSGVQATALAALETNAHCTGIRYQLTVHSLNASLSRHSFKFPPVVKYETHALIAEETSFRKRAS